MSRIEPRRPIVHTPRFQVYDIPCSEMLAKLREANLETPIGVFDARYYFTDMEGWGKVLSDLAFHSSLYKADRFDCDNYAIKAMSVCAERYHLNAFGVAIGQVPTGRHAFNIFYTGESFMLWEPNEGFPFSGSAFGIGEYGYQPELILI